MKQSISLCKIPSPRTVCVLSTNGGHCFQHLVTYMCVIWFDVKSWTCWKSSRTVSSVCFYSTSSQAFCQQYFQSNVRFNFPWRIHLILGLGIPLSKPFSCFLKVCPMEEENQGIQRSDIWVHDFKGPWLQASMYLPEMPPGHLDIFIMNVLISQCSQYFSHMTW